MEVETSEHEARKRRSLSYSKGVSGRFNDASSSGRQYIVQYMIQSEAGFYLQGMRLHVFQVTKLCYYFAAFIFALFSRSWA